MNTATKNATTFEPHADTMAEIATLSAAAVSTSNVLSVEDMTKQIRRIAEHAGVIASVIYEQTYQHAQRRASGNTAAHELPAYKALEEFHSSAKK